jgi:hypothetical protein
LSKIIGFGTNIQGTQINATIKKKIDKPYYAPFDPTTALVPGSIAPPFKNIPIIIEIMEGASCSILVKSVHHLQMIIRSIYPKSTNKSMI